MRSAGAYARPRQLLTGFAGVGVAQDVAEDYTQWRGAHRDGPASAFVQPGHWPEELDRRWKVHVGQGYATPLVVGEVGYSCPRREEREVVPALDAGTGEKMWNSGYAETYVSGRPATVHGAGPKAAPVYRDGRLFTLGISGVVAAFDARTGKIAWTVGEGGFCASPILAELAGTRQVVTVTTDSVVGVSFPEGGLLWR